MNQEAVVIVGAGIAGLATALGLHRLGIGSVVLEASDDLRITGFALTTWGNAWRALDALSIGDILRQKSTPIQGFKVGSRIPHQPGSEHVPDQAGAGIDLGEKNIESRCVKRRDLLETLVRELPEGTVRYSSRVVSIEESGYFKLVHLADGSVFQTKVLLGCDGINSPVAKWLGLQSPVSAGRSAIRGLVNYPHGHGFDPMFHVYFGGGVRYGFIPCDDTSVYWFCTFPPSLFKYDENVHDPLRMKQFVASNIRDIPKQASDLVERTELDSISCAALKLRLPWNVLLGKIAKGNVSVAGDALHPMTPDLGQGGCSALEDSIVLARCLGRALLAKPGQSEGGGGEYARIERGMEEYGRERRWRSFRLICTAYVVGFVQESNAGWMRFLRKAFMSKYTVATVFRMSQFDCGELVVS